MAQAPTMLEDRLREEFKDQLKATAEVLVVGGVARHEKALLRIDAVEKAAKVFEDNLNRVPTQLDRETRRLTELFDEKLRTANVEIGAFRDYVKTTRELLSQYEAAQRQNAKDAVAAAFLASKELTTAYTTGNEAARLVLDAKITSVTERVDRNEKAAAASDQRAAASEGMFAGGRGVVTLIIAIVAAAGVYITSHNAPDKRVDDIVDRLNALSARLTADQSKVAPSR